MISAAMIVRDAEATIRAALSGLLVTDEILLLDTGSKDRTVAVAMEDVIGAGRNAPALRVESWPWREDFAAARNEAQARCHGDWIVVLDADETLDAGNLRQCILRAPDDVDAVAVRVECQGEGGWEDRFWDTRRAYRKDRCHWIYPVHNQLVGVKKAIRSTAVIRTSYQGTTAQRLARSVPMLERLHAEQPTLLHAPLYLARMHAAAGNWAEALRWTEVGLPLCTGAPGEVALWTARVQATLSLQGVDAAEDVLHEALQRHQDAPDLWHQGIALSVARWVMVGAAARRMGQDLGIERCMPETAEEIARLQGALDTIGLGLTLRLTPTELP